MAKFEKVPESKDATYYFTGNVDSKDRLSARKASATKQAVKASKARNERQRRLAILGVPQHPIVELLNATQSNTKKIREAAIQRVLDLYGCSAEEMHERSKRAWPKGIGITSNASPTVAIEPDLEECDESLV